MSPFDDLPATDIARFALTDELLGPSRALTPDELDQRTLGLSVVEARELREYRARPNLDRQMRFRRELDELRELHVRASRALASAGEGRLRSWASLEADISHLHWQAQNREHTDVQGDLLRSLEALRDGILKTLMVTYPALGAIPHMSGWLLDLVDQAEVPGATFVNGQLVLIHGGSVWTSPQVTLDLTELGLGNRGVDRVDSRERQRSLFRGAATELLRDHFDGQGLDDQDFDDWRRTSLIAAQVNPIIERLLDQTHPRERRPYAISRVPQIRRDVALWVRVRIDGRSTLSVAIDNQMRADEDTAFRTRPGGRRSAQPTGERGVREAVSRAGRLLGEASVLMPGSGRI